MADKISSELRREVMSRVASKGTKPEKKVRQSLFRSGFRFRVNVRALPGTPDIVLPKYRTVIFVNGCFWHGHKGCKYYTVPETNTEYWTNKIKRNMERDEINTQRLESLSWSVITVWECELKSKALDETLRRVEAELNSNKEKWEQYCAHRKADRAFAFTEAKRKKAVREEIERELQEQFNIPARIVELSHEDVDL